MIDIDAIRKRTEEAVRKCFEKSEELVDKIEISSSSEKTDDTEEQINDRQVEILGKVFSADDMAEMAANEELLKKMAEEKAAEASENIMSLFCGEDMGILAAALEMLDEGEEEGEEEPQFSIEMEEDLYATLEETMARIASMPEPEAVPYEDGDGKWNRFGILLSGIVSKLNDHNLSSMDVEEHIPIMEQKIASLVRRSWGINGLLTRFGEKIIDPILSNGYYVIIRPHPQSSIVEKDINELEYSKHHKLLLANSSTPDRYKVKMLFPIDNIPLESSSMFDNIEDFQIDGKKVNDKIEISFTCQKYLSFTLFCQNEDNVRVVKKISDFDGKIKIYDDKVKPGNFYSYYVVATLQNSDKTEKQSNTIKFYLA